MRVCILGGLCRIGLGEILAGILAVGMVLSLGILIEVGCFVENGTTSGVGTILGSIPECTTEVDSAPPMKTKLVRNHKAISGHVLIRVDVCKQVLL